MATFNLAGLGKVAATGVAKQADIVKNRDRVQAEASEFKLRSAEADAQSDPNFIDNKVQALDAGFRSLIAKQTKRETTDQFRFYMKTGDPHHLTNLFKDNPKLSKQFQNLIAIERFDLSSPEDRSILARKGITEKNYNPNIHLKGITSNGSVDMFDAMLFGGATGALLDIQNEEADLYIKWLKMAGKEGNAGTQGEFEKRSRFISEQTGDSLPNVVGRQERKQLAGIEPGKLEEAKGVLKTLESSFEKGFFETDFTIEKNRRIAGPLITEYEALSGASFSAPDKANIKDINTLVTMANQFTGKVDEETAGFFDSNFRAAKNMISDGIDKGIVDENLAKSAYNSYRNLVLRSLSGATLTESEIKLFKESFGSLFQQFPAVITQFQTALTQLKSRLTSVSDLNNPYLSHYYLRNSPEDIGKMINNLDVVLEQFSQDKGNAPGEIIPDVNNNTLDDNDLSTIKANQQQAMKDAFGFTGDSQ